MLCNLFHNRFFVRVSCLSALIEYKGLIRTYCSSKYKLNRLEELKNCKETVERTITEEDVKLFSKVTGDYNSVHSKSGNNPGIVHGALLNGIVSGVIGTKLPGNGTIVLSQTLNFPKPCYIGETVIVSVEIEEARKILTCIYNVTNKKNNDVLLEGKAKLLFRTPKE